MAAFFHNLRTLLVVLLLSGGALASSQIDIPGPAGSVEFGKTVLTLSTGNIVVTDPSFNSSAGAVYLLNGNTGAIISTLKGSTPNDKIGSGGIIPLANGNFVVYSPLWDGAAADAGAITFGSGFTGVSGFVSPDNSLVGTSTSDLDTFEPVTRVIPLPNGNYVVAAPRWNGGTGAVTFCRGSGGTAGPISASNSLVGSAANDFVGAAGITVLANSNYVVPSPNWGPTDVGAVTFADGTTGISGTISSSNSLVGSTAGDQLGGTSYRPPLHVLPAVPAVNMVTALPNGNYVVRSPAWQMTPSVSVGAATWVNGNVGLTGSVTAANSLTGSTNGDGVGSAITVLTSSNYVVGAPNWDAAGVVDAGAATWCSGTVPTVSQVSAANSVVGTTAAERVGNRIKALTNGNYVVASSSWDGTGTNLGAVRLCDGSGGCAGPLTAANSLVGSTTNDGVGEGIFPLTNGNFVVTTPHWDSGPIADAGAATFVNGTTGLTGPVTPSNSLVGSTLNDQVGLGTDWGVVPLTNGNYVVQSHNWDSPLPNAGAVTFGNGTTGVSGPITSSNSLIGSNDGDAVGNASARPLANGNYIVVVGFWTGNAQHCGSVTFGNGTTGIAGEISQSNSIVGSMTNDGFGMGAYLLANGNYLVGMNRLSAVTFGDGSVGSAGVMTAANSFQSSSSATPLPNGDYVVKNGGFDNGPMIDVGAVSYLPGNTPTVGTPSSANSVIGTTAGGGGSMVFAFNSVNSTLVVGRPASRIVSIFDPGLAVSTATVSGRVMQVDGRGVTNAIVTITDGAGLTRQALTDRLGAYRLEDVPTGRSYTLSAAARRFVFAPMTVSLSGNVTNADFHAMSGGTTDRLTR